jgi:hypothetical protein
VIRGTLHRVWHPDFRNAWSEGGGVDRLFNGLNVVRGIGFGVICVVLGIGAIALGGWLGWIGGSVLLALALYGFVGPLLWPKYRPPAA